MKSVLIAMPTMGSVNVRTFISMVGLDLSGINSTVGVDDGSLVYMARNKLTIRAIEGGYDYICWIDSDMEFGADTVKRLLEDAESGMDFVTALCFKRSFPTYPTIFKDIRFDKTWDVDIYNDYPKDSVFEIAGAGMACCLIKTDLLKQVAEYFKCSPFEPLPSLGEDYSLCYRLREMGVKMFCDSRIKIGHVGSFVFNENTFNVQREASNVLHSDEQWRFA